MNRTHRQAVLFGLLIVVLVLGTFWAKQTCDLSRQRLRAAANETADCRVVVDSIHRLRGASIPADADLPEEQLYQCFHESAQFAGFDDRSVIRSISPQPARSMRGSSLRQQDVNLDLQGMTMEQLVRFLQHLHSTHSQLQVSAMKLREPKGLGPAALWDVQPLVLSYQIKEPSISTDATASNR
jgi:hypothetical protein